MDNSNTMTINFLRARLLSERSVSRSAKLRADQLASRVMELEDQLRIVTIQRKKAEEAAAEVLAILECQEISDSSEVIDSGSDRSSEVPVKEEDHHISTHTITESTQLQDKLTWRSPTNDTSFQAKERQSSFRSIAESSPKRHLAKSCRKIRQNNSRLTAKDDPRKTVIHDTHAIGGETSRSLAARTDILGDIPTKETEDVAHSVSIPCALYDSKRQINHVCSDNGCDKVETMERALEKQAQLIDQFQVEENAQRDWEEKYSENLSSNLRLTAPGNKLHASENTFNPMKNDGECAKEYPFSDERKLRPGSLSNSKEPTVPFSTISMVNDQKFHDTNQGKSNRTMEASNLSGGSVSRGPIGTKCPLCFDGFLMHQFDQSTLIGNGSFKEGTQETADGKVNQEHPFSSTETPNSNVSLHSMDITFSGNTNERISEWRPTDTQNRSSRQVVQHTSKQHPSKNLEGVLQALQRAKLSLNEELSRPLSSQRSSVTVPHVDMQIQPIDYDKMLGIPVRPTGLFRLPTDSFAQDNLSYSKLNTHSLRLAAIQPDQEHAPAEPILPANSKLDASGLRLAAIRPNLEYPLSESFPGSSLSGSRIDSSVSRVSATGPDLEYLHTESFIRSGQSGLRLAAIRPDLEYAHNTADYRYPKS